jgi:hypothetical protein
MNALEARTDCGKLGKLIINIRHMINLKLKLKY